MTGLSLTGFTTSDRVMVWDDTTWEWATIATVVSGTVLSHTPVNLSKAYLVSSPTQVALIREVVYRYDATNLKLERMEDLSNWTTIAENVSAFALAFTDADNLLLTPDTDALRKKIRRIAISAEVRTAMKDRNTGKYHLYPVVFPMIALSRMLRAPD